jgi:CubicO group peptidase (beta-lactamase class C family)
LKDFSPLRRENGAVTTDPFQLVASWPVDQAAVAVVGADGRLLGATGPAERAFPLASVTKLITATATLVAVEEGTLSLEDPAGPEGATVRHLLAHASGLGFEGGRMAAPGRRRIYSNAGFEALAGHLAAAAGMPFAQYTTEAVLAPLGMTGSTMAETGGYGGTATIGDLARLGGEFLQPTLVSTATLAAATTVAFPGLDGVLPGFGRQNPNDWGLGFELRDGKSPHWTGTRNSARTFGHFGRSGTFLWVDPDAGLACACLTDRDFGPWAAEAWPRLSDAVLDAHGGHAMSRQTKSQEQSGQT